MYSEYDLENNYGSYDIYTYAINDVFGVFPFEFEDDDYHIKEGYEAHVVEEGNRNIYPTFREKVLDEGHYSYTEFRSFSRSLNLLEKNYEKNLQYQFWSVVYELSSKLVRFVSHDVILRKGIFDFDFSYAPCELSKKDEKADKEEIKLMRLDNGMYLTVIKRHYLHDVTLEMGIRFGINVRGIVI